MDTLIITNTNSTIDKEAVQAQKQWELDGTVTTKYLSQILGDISKNISVFGPDIKKNKDNTESCSHSS
jgi:hypothetical protein